MELRLQIPPGAKRSLMTFVGQIDAVQKRADSAEASQKARRLLEVSGSSSLCHTPQPQAAVAKQSEFEKLNADSASKKPWHGTFP